ncbi:hypothetical protein SAMN02983003_2411 [Devosia enhydra]|uniref:Uncharacterized protein n=1 Tax=Devosia enhydra TaxID=665118 RepID=A0A1K2I0E7_9HYPH|nr:hypothetical protein SAMN02983003_2411 [Devosia enhydra]
MVRSGLGRVSNHGAGRAGLATCTPVVPANAGTSVDRTLSPNGTLHFRRNDGGRGWCALHLSLWGRGRRGAPGEGASRSRVGQGPLTLALTPFEHSSLAFSPQIAPPERFGLRHGSKPPKGEGTQEPRDLCPVLVLRDAPAGLLRMRTSATYEKDLARQSIHRSARTLWVASKPQDEDLGEVPKTPLASDGADFRQNPWPRARRR